MTLLSGEYDAADQVLSYLARVRIGRQIEDE